MELKHVIPNMEKTFGTLEFAGENKVEQRMVYAEIDLQENKYERKVISADQQKDTRNGVFLLEEMR